MVLVPTTLQGHFQNSFSIKLRKAELAYIPHAGTAASQSCIASRAFIEWAPAGHEGISSEKPAFPVPDSYKS